MTYVKIVTAEVIEGFPWESSEEEIVKSMAEKIREFADRLTIEDLNIETRKAV